MLKHFGVYSTEVELNADVTNELLLEPWIVYISSSNIIKYSDGRYVSLDIDEQNSEEQGGGSGGEQGGGSGGSQEPVTPVHDYSQDYLTIEVLSDGNLSIDDLELFDELSYSKDNGQTWNLVESNESNTSINLYTGDIVLLKSNKCTTDTLGGSGTVNWNNATFNVYGNIMSLCYGDNFTNKTVYPENCSFCSLFHDSGVISAEHLILPGLDLSVSYGLSGNAYEAMFSGCTSLTIAPELPATILSNGCYKEMFYGCISLTTAPELPATILSNGCYKEMFYGCISLTTAPELPALTLSDESYAGMFNECSSLNYVKCLATDISASDCVSLFIMGVASSGTFVKNPNMTDWVVGSPGDSNSNIPDTWTLIDAA